MRQSVWTHYIDNDGALLAEAANIAGSSRDAMVGELSAGAASGAMDEGSLPSQTFGWLEQRPTQGLQQSVAGF